MLINKGLYKYLKNPKIVICHKVSKLHTSHLNNLIHIAMLSRKSFLSTYEKNQKIVICNEVCPSVVSAISAICHEVVKLHTPHLNSSIAMPSSKVLSQVPKWYQKNQKIVICHEVMKLHTSHQNNSIAMLSNKVLEANINGQ